MQYPSDDDNYCSTLTLSLAIVFVVSLFLHFSFFVIKIENVVANAQQLLPQQTQQHISNSLGVKILSPLRGDSIPIGKDLTVSGQSTDNGISECNVSIIVNDVRPYQKALPGGKEGNGDYSSWIFHLTNEYTPIKEGPNEITARLSCTPTIDSATNMNISKWYSINVTGFRQLPNVTSNPLDNEQPSVQQQQQQPLGNKSGEVAKDDGGKKISQPFDIGNSNGVTDFRMGGNENDRINGTSGESRVGGGNGNDVIRGKEGNDVIAGGNGNDQISGNRGDDVLSGQNGNDVIQGNEGNDVLSGKNGDDRIFGGAGDDIMSGQNGSDMFDCGGGIDTIVDFGFGDTKSEDCENF